MTFNHGVRSSTLRWSTKNDKREPVVFLLLIKIEIVYESFKNKYEYDSTNIYISIYIKLLVILIFL